MAYADMEIVAALRTLSSELIRAVKIKMVVNDVYGNESPERALGMLIAKATGAAALYPLNMEKETVLAELTLQRPQPDYVDSILYNSPLKRGQLGQRIRDKRAKLNPTGEQ
ncbi:aldehyde dehydrogenase [Yersinia enterocolitica]|nr:aldehyde dehydrogenase [Yersinia enterocolitica]